jgi:predicted ATP-grasp superfamily ATP-dependent carboligase
VEKVIFVEDFTKKNCQLVCSNYSIDIIVPIGFAETLLFSKFVSDSEFKNIITVSNYDNILFVANKHEISEYINNIGVSSPKIYDVKSRKFLEEKTFFDQKFFIKPSKEGLIKKYFNIKNVNEFIKSRKFFSDIGYSDEDVILQEFIEGDGVGYFAVCNHGEPLVEYSHIRVREWPKKGGYSTACRTYNSQELSSLSRRIIKSLNWRGPIMIEYRKSKRDGKFYFIEINPKFWGSLELGLSSGVNIVDALFQITTQSRDNIQTDSIADIAISWPFDGDAFHYLTTPGLIFELFSEDLIVSTGLLRDPLYGLLKLAYFPIRLFKEYRT